MRPTFILYTQQASKAVGQKRYCAQNVNLTKKALSSSRQHHLLTLYTTIQVNNRLPKTISQLADNSTSLFFLFESSPKVHSVFTRVQKWNIVVGVATRLWDGLSGFRILAEVKVFFSSPQRPIQLVPVFSTGGKKGRGVKLTNHLHLLPRLRLCGAIPLCPLYDFMACTGIS